MTRSQTHLSSADLRAILSDIMAEAGAWRVLRIATMQALHRAPRAPEPDQLNDHMRRDIGLPPAQSPPPPPGQVLF